MDIKHTDSSAQAVNDALVYARACMCEKKEPVFSDEQVMREFNDARAVVAMCEKRPNEDDYPELRDLYARSCCFVKFYLIHDICDISTRFCGIIARLVGDREVEIDYLVDHWTRPIRIHDCLKSDLSEFPDVFRDRLSNAKRAATWCAAVPRYATDRESYGRPEVSVQVVRNAPPRLQALLAQTMIQYMHTYFEWSDELARSVTNLHDVYSSVDRAGFLRGVRALVRVFSKWPEERLHSLPGYVREALVCNVDNNLTEEIRLLLKLNSPPTDRSSEELRNLWKMFTELHEGGASAKRQRKR